MKNLTLTGIWIYPIKSLGGIRLKRAKVQEKGLEYDRRWMLVDEQGMFMTQRVLPQMALFKLSMNNDKLIITKRDPRINPDTISLSVNATPKGKSMPVMIWNDEVIAIEVDPALSSWFSGQLDFNCRLVSFPEKNPRPVDPEYKVNNENVSLADAYPFMILGESTLADLNTRLKEPVPMDRFRPNFVFKGGDPYEEDTWRDFKIGENRFVGVKPCGRCALTTVNQDTAEKGIEPLLTLSTYRKQNNKVNFGQNLVAVDHSEVFEGDVITLS
jgi:uncharacterized protein